MTPKNVAIEAPGLLKRYDEIERSEGKTVDELTTEAVKRDVARRWLEKNKREAQLRRGNMTEDEVEAVVQRAIEESRAEQRARRDTPANPARFGHFAVAASDRWLATRNRRNHLAPFSQASRKASVGLMRSARRAGPRAASTPVASITSAVTASQGT